MRSNAQIFEKVYVGDKISYQKEKEFLTKQLQKQKAEDQFIKLDFFCYQQSLWGPINLFGVFI